MLLFLYQVGLALACALLIVHLAMDGAKIGKEACHTWQALQKKNPVPPANDGPGPP